MKPFRAKVARLNHALVLIVVLQGRAERHLASNDVWQRQAVSLFAEAVEEQTLFLAAVAKLPPKIAAAPAVGNIDLSIKRLLTTLGALEPVRRQLVSQGRTEA